MLVSSISSVNSNTNFNGLKQTKTLKKIAPLLLAGTLSVTASTGLTSCEDKDSARYKLEHLGENLAQDRYEREFPTLSKFFNHRNEPTWLTIGLGLIGAVIYGIARNENNK